MDGKRFGRLLTLVFCVGVAAAACSSSQEAAVDGVVGFERTTTASTSRIQIGAQTDENDPPTSSNDESLIPPTTGSATADAPAASESSGETIVGSAPGSTPSSTPREQFATSTTAPTSKTTEPVAQDDLVACAEVEVGYLFLLEGESVKAVPYLEQGASHSVHSVDSSYANAALALSEAIGTSSVTSNADAFLAVCAGDGFERLA